MPWLRYIFQVLDPLLMPEFYISLISFFTVVVLYPDLTQHKIIIEEFCYMYAYITEKCWLLMLHF